jgi:hypothetical protein
LEDFMPADTDYPTTSRPAKRFLSTLRDVLFEPSVERPSATPALVDASADEQTVELALAALRQSLEPDIGPSAREYALQVEALSDALPDPALRRRAALRVLSLKGVTREALALELDRVLTALSTQAQAFANKVAARAAALEQRRSEAAAACQRETAEADQSIARLEAALAAERTKINKAGAERERLFAECEGDAAELAAKQRGFERAFAALNHQYETSKRELVSTESS